MTLSLPSSCSVEEFIDAVIRSAHPVWVDRAQRRRWLEGIASTQRTRELKLIEMTAALGSIGVRVELA